ncbi:exodeoxyribonuclease III [Christensenellaceae bacterium OttesenSCG-928-L17]|nr:exodeoxyribonuclease III [Christensenellaceae bacterium OttesenSCG-928-L17]
MKLFSWNVNGIRANIRKGTFEKFVKEYNPDILCLQETKAKQGQVEIDLPDYQEIWNSATRAGYSGTAIFTKIPPLSTSFGFGDSINSGHMWHEDQHGDTTSEGRVITAEYQEFFLICVYTPNAKHELTRLQLREELWDPAMLSYITELEKQKPVIICGDFNVAHQPIDLARPKDNEGNAGYTTEERAGFDAYIKHGMIDTFRYLHPDETDAYTWWTFRANARIRNIGWRIDYFLISSQLKSRLQSANIYPTVEGSDHCPISIEIN